MNEIIENIHYATVYFFHSICAVCLPKYLSVMTLRCDEWRIGSPFLPHKKPFIMPKNSSRAREAAHGAIAVGEE